MPSRTVNLPIRRVDQPPAIPPRPIDGQKGLFGRVLIVGGSHEMIGAPAMAATSALRMGSGLVQIAVPETILAAVLSIIPEAIGLALGKKPDLQRLLEAAGRANVIAIGPGLGQSATVARRIQALLNLEKPMVVDADALNYLATIKRWPKFSGVLTPHPGEMHRLTKTTVPTDDRGRIDLATKFAAHHKKVLVLKGHRTVVTDGHRVYVNTTGDSSLSKAGSGDVLTGMVASLIGQKMDLFEAACLAVHLHGKAGELAGKKLGRRCVLARDVIDSISPLLR
ncbi:MAG: NAD(P)H-hydrate dehydratase [Tepidisphaeraceae bacterium]|jgi:NAD(P)H-hydrate epimerase